jgi:hypothetical protein
MCPLSIKKVGFVKILKEYKKNQQKSIITLHQCDQQTFEIERA